MRFLFVGSVIVVLLILSGCASSQIEIPVSALTNEESRMKAYSVIGDASTAKEAIIHKTWQNYHVEYQKAYVASGFNMSYQQIKLSDGTMALLPLVSFKPQPQMAAPPTEPSQHPVWKTVDNVVNRGIMWAGIGWVAHEFSGMQKASYDAAGNTYNGPTTMKGSYNTAGQDNYVTMAGTQNTSTGTDNSQAGASPVTEEEEWAEGGGRCRDDDSCVRIGYVCSRHDGEIGECIKNN